ncbi:MAG: hypothetical protein AB7I37_00125 [Pirellulales bacterium]
MISAASSTKPDPLPPGPASNVRTTVTFLLILHLFTLAVAVLSNEPASQLFRALRSTPGVVPYLQLIAQDNPYRTDYTTGSFKTEEDGNVEADTDFHLEANLALADGTEKLIVLPEPGLKGARARRYQNLAWQIASQAINAKRTGDEGPESILPKAIGTSLLKQYDAKDIQFSCRGHLPQLMEDVNTADPELGNPQSEHYFTTPYRAIIKATRNGVIVVKLSSSRESSPAAK